MTGTTLGQLVAVLTLWAVLSLGSAVVGLYCGPREVWRQAWFMSGLWGLIDGLIAVYAIVAPPLSDADLSPILRFNAGLDVAYILAGIGMLTRRSATLRGFGGAVLVHGLFLLALDVTFWLRTAG